MSNLYYTTKEKVDIYEAVVGVFDELFKELKELGKKKPETILSAAKVKVINRVLEDVMDCLKDEANFKYLELLDDEALPQYSDAILMLAQFDGALKTFRERHYGYHKNRTQWVIREEDNK